MLGAIVGDVIGSIYEWDNIKTKDFELVNEGCYFTDDTVLTVALAESILSGESFASVMKRYYRRYPGCGYGGRFEEWAGSNDSRPYNSWGNGAAMRISPVGYAFESLQAVLAHAESFTAVTHNHPAGIKGGQAVAAAVFLGRTGSSKQSIKKYLSQAFHYDLTNTVDNLRLTYEFDESCQKTVPEALICFFESTSFEDAIRNAISIGGDSDTIACITGAVAEAFYGGVPADIADQVTKKLSPQLLGVCQKFTKLYIQKNAA